MPNKRSAYNDSHNQEDVAMLRDIPLNKRTKYNVTQTHDLQHPADLKCFTPENSCRQNFNGNSVGL